MKILHKSYSWLSSLLLMVMFAVAGTISAETVTFSMQEIGAEKVEKGGVTLTWAYAPKYNEGADWGFVKFPSETVSNANKLTVTAEGTVTKISIVSGWGSSIGCTSPFTATPEGTITEDYTSGDSGTITWAGEAESLLLDFAQGLHVYGDVVVEYTAKTVEPEPVDPVVGNVVTIDNLGNALHDHLNNGTNENPVNIDGVTITTSGILNSMYGFQLRSGKYLTLAAPAGRKIVGVDFTANANFVNYVAGMEVTSGSLAKDGNNVVWTGEAESVTFTSVQNYTYLTGVVVTLNEETVEPEPVDPVDPEQPTEMVEKTVTLDYAAIKAGGAEGFSVAIPNMIDQASLGGVYVMGNSLITVTAPEGINMVSAKFVETPEYHSTDNAFYMMTFDSGEKTVADDLKSATWTGKANKVVATTGRDRATILGSIIVTYEEPAPVVDPVDPEPDPEVEPVLVTKTATFDWTSEFVTEAEDIVCTSNGAEYSKSMGGVSVLSAYSTPLPYFLGFTAPEDATITKIEFTGNSYGNNYGGFMKGQTWNDSMREPEWKYGKTNGTNWGTWTGEANSINFYNASGSVYVTKVEVTYQYWETPNEVIFNFKKGLVDEVEGVKLETEGNIEYSTLNNAMNVSGYNPPSTFTFVAPEGKYLEKIELIAPDVEFSNVSNVRYVERVYGKGDVVISDDFKTLTWTGKANRVTFAATVMDAQIQRANVYYGDVETWEGDLAVTVSDANSLEDLETVTVTFADVVEVNAAAGNVLGAVLDEAGNPVSIVYAAEGFDYFGSVEFDTNEAAVTFVKIADLKAELRQAAAASAARIAAFAPATNYAQVVFAPKSFLVDGKVYNKVICKEYTFGGLTTGIESVATSASKAIYDLSGRRVMKAQEGLYIVDGKKVIR